MLAVVFLLTFPQRMHICLFDIDGTLLASGGAGKAAMEMALVTEFGVAESDHRVPFSGRTDRAICHDLLRHYGLAATPENWQRLSRAYLGHLPGFLSRNQGRVLPGI